MKINLKKIVFVGAVLMSVVFFGCQPQKQILTTPRIVESPGTQVETASTVETAQVPNPQSVDISANMPFILKIGQMGVFKLTGATIVFDAVKSDSRCPKGVQCIWAGEATVQVKARGFKVAGENEVTVNVSSIGGAVLLGESSGVKYSLLLVDLIPYPSAGTKKVFGEDTATLKLLTEPAGN
jgi:hypothetical protein